MKVDQPLVEDDTDRGFAVAERNDPDPIAEACVVIRGQPARADVARSKIARTCGDVVDVANAVPTAPDRGDGMLFIALDQAEAATEEVDASRGVEEPAASKLADL